LLATVAREKPSTNLIPASGDQDHAISPSALGAFVNCAKASIASRTTFRDDREAPLCVSAGWREKIIISDFRKEIFSASEAW
jgi:hypothetical protein